MKRYYQYLESQTAYSAIQELWNLYSKANSSVDPQQLVIRFMSMIDQICAEFVYPGEDDMLAAIGYKGSKEFHQDAQYLTTDELQKKYGFN